MSFPLLKNSSLALFVHRGGTHTHNTATCYTTRTEITGTSLVNLKLLFQPKTCD